MSDAAIDDPVLAAIAAQLGAALPDMPLDDRLRFANSIRGGEPYAPGPEAVLAEGVAPGTVTAGRCPAGAVYPGVEHDYWVYVPGAHAATTPAALMVFFDGARYLGPEIAVPAVLDNLIASGAVPPTVAVFCQPGAEGPGPP